MKAEKVMDELMDIRRTIGKLHNPEILSIVISESIRANVHLYITGDPTEIIAEIGNGLIDVDEEWDTECARCSMIDTNGVEVYWLKWKAAPEAGTSEAAKDEAGANCYPSIVDDDIPIVKEAVS